MEKLPWLDSLSDDWVSMPGSPASPGTPNSPVPSPSVNHSRRSSLHQSSALQSSPSRIPVPARRRSVEPSPSSDKKKVPRPCHFVKREPPTPKTPRTPKTPSKLRSPVPDKSKKSPKPTPPSKRKPSAGMEKRSPLRSVSNASGQSSQKGTVQVRPSRGTAKEETPEWRKRLVQGEIPSGEQRDLFAPIGLESVFKPPTPGTEKNSQNPLPHTKLPDDGWDLDQSLGFETSYNSMKTEEKHVDGAWRNTSQTSSTKRGSHMKEATSTSPQGSPSASLRINKAAGKLRPNRESSQEFSQRDPQMRTASGVEDMRNEDITPITFSRTNTVDGNGTSEVIRSALKQVTNKLQKLHLAPWERPDSRASDSVLLDQQSDPVGDTLPDDDLDVTSHSLPQDLSVGTLDYRGRKAFTSLRGEPYLGENTFQKRRIVPSSHPSQRLSPFLPASSRIRSSPPIFNKMNPMADPPTLPRPSSAHVRSTSPDDDDHSNAMPSSGSPLKLFGPHDTFTNNRLMRRMSQFEETFSDLSEEDEPMSPSEEARRKGETRSQLGSRHDTFSDRSSRRSERPTSRHALNSRITRFGDGQLDNFDFSDTSPYEPQIFNNYGHASNSGSRPSSRRQRYLRRTSYRSGSRDLASNSSMSNTRSLIRSRLASGTNVAKPQDHVEKENVNPSGKPWAPRSPPKDPNPKRRRTILLSEDSRNNGGHSRGGSPIRSDNLSLIQRSLLQHGMSHEDKELSLRPPSSQRPRTPTPSQTRSYDGPRHSPRKDSKDQSYAGHNDPEEENAPADPNVPKVKVTGANEEMRKGSITTQDFLTEATKIMDIIRSKGGGAGGLSSLQESDAENDNESGSYEDESTREDFSRPPSREGVDMRKLREPQEPNQRVLSHLKKFQENDDMEFGSVMSLRLGQDDSSGSPSKRGNDSEQRKRKLSAPSDADEDDDLPDLNQLSFKSISGRSIPTGSSHSSHAKGVLSSDLVSHLIPEQVNGLTYDRSRHQWIKGESQKSPQKPKGEESEDDPFRDISDLSVDERKELMRTHGRLPTGRTTKSKSTQDVQTLDHAEKKLDARPQSKDAEQSVITSSVQSKATHFTSSFPNTGTGATSWGTDPRISRESSSEVKHEIKLDQGHLSNIPRRQTNNNHQARVVTIGFSSPLVSQVAYSDDESPAKLRKEAPNAVHGQDAQAEEKHGESSQPKNAACTARRNSIHEEPFLRRSISRIDEKDEDAADNLSLVRRNSMPSEPMPLEHYNENSLGWPRNAGQDTSYSFHMSTLPEFTVNQNDQSLQLEVSYVAQRTHPTSLRQIHGQFALATEELVKHITEAEPFEPDWEHVRRLILRRKGLITLHKLADFCPRLEDLDVSENEIGQLSGIPSSLRTLRIQNNYLTSLTAWGHLTNLQYLDVSGNELESLDALSGLIHLREINARDNNIRDIAGVSEMNGLLSLKLGNNALTAVDFSSAELTRLQELDLSHNQLVSVQGLDSLPALSVLDLSFNQLSKVEVFADMPRLKSLRVSSNRLRALDVGTFPSLSLLYIDQNFLSTVSGLGRCRGLQVFSAREQLTAPDINNGFFDVDLGTVKDIRKVFLSSNKLSMQTLSPSSPLSSLQLLDAASCSIQALPTDFALNFPNVKVLNLNFNSLAGINELVGMNCLSRLAIAGNCISRLRKFCQVLSRLGRTNKAKSSSLRKIDARGNPLTLRFYPPALTGSGRSTADSKQLQPATEQEERDPHNPIQRLGMDIPSALAELGRYQDDLSHLNLGLEHEDHEPALPSEKDLEINDPYTLPPAEPQADQKYLSHLDDPTRLRRRVFELMLYAGTGGSLRFLDGLELSPTLEAGSDIDVAWRRLEKLGVLKKKAIAA